MKVLHLFSNRKWTGPAEPALNLCIAQRALGIEADFACSNLGGDAGNRIVEIARDRGVEPIQRFRLQKQRNPFWNALDRLALSRLLKERPYDILHCHLNNDHRIAKRPAIAHRIPIVRSSYEGLGMRRLPNHGRLLHSAEFVLQPSQAALDYDAEQNGVPRERMCVAPGAVDTVRFDPAREVPDGRKWLGVPHDAFVVGIVARMQRHRKFDVFFQAIHRLIQRVPTAHVIVVGRGTYQESVGLHPVKELGLEGRVHFSGYVDGENYVGMLKALDVKVLMMPGSDGTCRAVREAMAMAKPAVVSMEGMLPEIVEDAKDGYVFDGSAEGLSTALLRLATDRNLARTMGRQARKKAESAYSLDAQARVVLDIYEKVLAARTRWTGQ